MVRILISTLNSVPLCIMDVFLTMFDFILRGVLMVRRPLKNAKSRTWLRNVCLFNDA